jgi:hypothetical protein
MYVVKIIPCLLSGRYKLFQKASEWMVEQNGKFLKLFHAYCVCGKNYSTPTEYAVKIIPRLLSVY